MANEVEKLSLLIIPDKRIDLDLIAGSISLAEAYRDINYDVSLLVDESNYPTFIENIFPRRGINKFDSGRSKEYILTLKNENVKINSVDWKQDKDKIQLIISTENGDIQADNTMLQKATGMFDKVIMLGSKEPKDLGDFYNNNNELFEENKLFKIKYDKNIDKKTHPYLQNSISEKVFEYLKEQKVPITKFTSTNLLAGIYWKTSGFTDNLKNPNVFKIVAELIDLGANLDIAIKKSFQNLKVEELALIGKIFNNFKVDENNIGLSVVKKDEIKDIKINHLIFRYWDIVKYTFKAKVAIVLLEQDKVNGYVFSNVSRVSAAEVANEFGGDGTQYKAIIESASEITVVENQLRLKVAKLLGGKPQQKEESKTAQSPSTSNTSENQNFNDMASEDRTNKNEAKSEEVKIDRIPKPVKVERNNAPDARPEIAPVRLDENRPDRTIDKIEPKREEESGFYGGGSYTPSFDPLAPATSIPEPLDLNGENLQKKKEPSFKSPLPTADDY